MLPSQFDLSLWQGNTTPWQFVLQQSLGVPVDLTGSEIVAWFKWSGGEFRLSTLTGNTGPFPPNDTSLIDVPTPTNGTVNLTLSAGATRAIVGTAQWELERRIGGNQYSYLYGNVKPTRWLNDDV
ncbi:MAG: hypothetical protein KGL63_14805 [Betaproteobacteria bacterium]|nr:hypothetical protein [Betaproteobacteria bacterium]